VRKIGVLGGSFNPVHLGHLLLAETAREALELEKVLLIPAKLPPHKSASALAGGRDRLEMVRLAAAENPALEASDIELRRAGVSYTVDTVQALREQYGADAEIYFLIGLDTVSELPSWHEVRRLAGLCKFVPLSRPRGPRPRSAALQRAIGRDEARAILGRAIAMPLLEISSSDIRRRIAAGRSIRYLVPDSVIAYIRRRRLYA
jgi:nicotinate-nucleotide adenylyltransferase